MALGAERRAGWGLMLAAVGGLLGGCASPCGKVTDDLRHQTIQQQQEIDGLKSEAKNSDATISELRANQPTVATLPADRLADLFTADRIEIGTQTMATAVNTGDPVNAFRVIVRTKAADGTVLPATGNLTIEIFDLGPPPVQPQRVGTWTFTPAEMKKNWYSGLGMTHFAFVCPWKTAPVYPDVMFRATFTDALTGRTLVAQLSKRVERVALKTVLQ